MNHRKYSPERAFWLQAGVKPLQNFLNMLALKGRQIVLSPPSGLGLYPPVYRGFPPCLWPLQAFDLRVGNLNL